MANDENKKDIKTRAEELQKKLSQAKKSTTQKPKKEKGLFGKFFGKKKKESKEKSKLSTTSEQFLKAIKEIVNQSRNHENALSTIDSAIGNNLNKNTIKDFEAIMPEAQGIIADKFSPKDQKIRAEIAESILKIKTKASVRLKSEGFRPY